MVQASTPEQVPSSRILRDLTSIGIQTWTPVTIRRIRDRDLAYALAAIERDDAELTRALAGPNSDPATLHHTVLEEMGDRGLFQNYYLGGVASVEVAERYAQGRPDPMTFRRASITMGGVSNSTGGEREVRTNPVTMAIFDNVAGNIFFDVPRIDPATGRPRPVNASPLFALSHEQADAIGLPRLPGNRLYGSTMNDVRRYGLAYALGRQDEFNPRNPNATLTVDIRPERIDEATGQRVPVRFQEIEPAYCSLLPTMYQAGDQFNPRDISAPALMQARVDEIRVGDDRPGIGYTAPCTPARPAAANQR